MMENRMDMSFSAIPRNESFARVVVAAFVVQLNPTLPEMADIKTAVSEAVTNAIVHGYRERPSDPEARVELSASIRDDGEVTVIVRDDGCGIVNVEQAMQPFYSTGDGAERSGMGFCVMQTFMDTVEVQSAVGEGTTVTMRKLIRPPARLRQEADDARHAARDAAL